MSAGRWIEDSQAEAELTKEEAQVSKAEEELSRREAGLRPALADLVKRFEDIEQKLTLLGQVGSKEAIAALRQLPELVPPPGGSGRGQTLEARRRALWQRRQSIDQRLQAVAVVEQSMVRSEQGLLQAKANTDRIESARAEGKRQAWDEARAAVAPAESAPIDLVKKKPAAVAPAKHTQLARDAEPPVREPPPRVAAAPAAENDRRLPRVRMDCAVDFESESNFFTGFARNLSSGGLFVATFDFLPVGTLVDLTFSLPAGDKVTAAAEVRWVRELNKTATDVTPGMGLYFTGLTPEVETAIRSFMEAREPLFFPEV